MATTITQARPLLTAAELELFDQSRAEPIKALTLARLRGKVTRTRTLRDKYRDLFRRQTVAVRSAPSTKGRSPVGADNQRTQRKADILQEVLGRFEARVAQLEEREARDAARAASQQGTAKKTAKRSTKNGESATLKAPAASKSPTTKTVAKKPSATSKPAQATGEKAAKKPAPAKKKGAETSSKALKLGTKPAKSGAAAKGAAPAARRKTSTARSQSAMPQTAANGSGVGALHSGVAGSAPVLPEHSVKAPSPLAPTTQGKARPPQVNAPVDLVPAALRVNPLRQSAGNMAIHAHQSGSIRRAQGKRDSR